MSVPEPGSCPRARPDVVFRRLDDEWVLFDPTSTRLHALNLSAALVWVHCTGELSVAEIAREVRDAFGEPVDLPRTLADVAAAVERFAREGLLA